MSKIHRYTSEAIDVTFDAKRCIHAAECVRGLPEVFNRDKRPWAQPGNADPAINLSVIWPINKLGSPMRVKALLRMLSLWKFPIETLHIFKDR